MCLPNNGLGVAQFFGEIKGKGVCNISCICINIPLYYSSQSQATVISPLFHFSIHEVDMQCTHFYYEVSTVPLNALLCDIHNNP